jgi:non-ribosomal peptide synthetase component E (peptide arylation enzyme)
VINGLPQARTERKPPTPAGNVGRLLFEAARMHPGRVAVIFQGQQWSYRELNDRVNALALGLTKLGL